MIRRYGKAFLARFDQLQEPVRTVAAHAVIAALAVGLGETGMARPRISVAVVIAAAIGGIGAVAWSGVRRRQWFWVADGWVAHRCGERIREEVVRERCATLVGPRHRRGIAPSLRRAVTDVHGPAGQTARVPVESAIACGCGDDLRRVADALADRPRTVTPRALALPEELMTDCGSPVHRNEAPAVRALQERLRATQFELEGSLHA